MARTIWKRKFLILGVWTLLSIVIVVVVSRIPAVYQADALVLVDSQKIPDKFVSATVNSDLQDRLSNISQQILSSTRLKKVIDDYGLYAADRKKLFEEELLDKMRKDITVKLEPGYNRNRPGAFHISYQGTDPATVAQVTNRLANLFIEENLRTREVQAEGTSEFIAAQLQEAKKNLDGLEKAVSEYKQQHSGELPQQENSISSTLTRLQLELAANRDAQNRIQDNKVLLQNSLATAEATLETYKAAASAQNNSQSPSVASISLPNQNGAALRQTPLEIRQAQLEALKQRYGPLHPEVRRLEAEISQLKLDEARQQKNAPASESQTTQAAPVPAPPTTSARSVIPVQNLREALDVTSVNERIATIKAQIALTDKDLEFRKAEQARIVRDLSAYEGRLSHLPIREQELAQVTRDYEMSKANYKSLLDKKFAAEMATDMEHRQKSESFTLLDAATTPGKPQKPNRPLLDIGGSIFGLILGLAIAFGQEVRRDVFLGEWELPAGASVIARLPMIVVPGTDSVDTSIRSPEKPKNSKFRRGAIVCSVVVAAIGIAAVGWFAVMHR